MKMLQELAQLCEVMFSIIYYIFWIGFSIGQLISWLFGKIFNDVTWSFVLGLHEASILFYQDFAAFSVELFTILQHIVSIALKNAYEFIRIVATFPEQLQKLTTFSGPLLVQPHLLDDFNKIVDGSKELMIETGHGFWFAVTLLPNIVVIFLTFLCGIIRSALLWTKISLWNVLNFAVTKFVALNNYFLDFPLRATCGLICALLIIQNRSKVIRGVKMVVKLLLKLIMKGVLLLLQKAVHQAYHVLRSISLLRLLFYSRSRRVTTTNVNSDSNTSHSSTGTSSPDTSTGRYFRPTKRKPIRKMATKTNRTIKPKIHDQSLCIICQDKEKNVVLFPCRHLCLCTECATDWCRQPNVCPLCRQQICRRVSVYV